jgi:AcrR family transcriptional regulator
MSRTVQPRSYDSSSRRAQALANRARILEAARALFITNGFAATSVTAIAAAAGVSAPTVFSAFGSKVNLLKEAAETTIVGDVEAVPMAERPEMRHVHAAPTADELLDRLCDLLASRAAAVQPIFAVMYGARDGYPEIAELIDLLDEQRLSGATGLARTLAARLGTDDGDRIAELRDCIWATMSPTWYESFVVKRGWSLEHYRAWVRAALQIPVDHPHPRP